MMQSLKSFIRRHSSCFITDNNVIPNAAAQYLPPELVDQILEDLMAGIYSNAFAFTLSPGFFYESRVAEEMRIVQQNVARVIQVCRSWNISGSALLYSRPMLTSTRHIDFFCRTIIKNPDLAALVHEVVVLQHGAPDVLVTGKFVSARKRDVSHKHILSENKKAKIRVAVVLKHCSALQAFTISSRCLPVISCVPLIEPKFIEQSQISASLRRLTISGFFFPIRNLVSNGLDLPLLEELCLRDMVIVPGFRQSHFPNLHTFRMARIATMDCHLTEALLPRTGLPSLRALELYYNSLHKSFSEDLLRYLPQLERLYIIGLKTEHVFFTAWASANVTMELKRCALALLPPCAGHPIERWRVPNQLEELTVVVNIAVQTPEFSALISLARFVEFNKRKFNGGEFRRLTVEVETAEPVNVLADVDVGAAVDDLRKLCESSGIRLTVNQNDHWVTWQLTGAPPTQDYWDYATPSSHYYP